MIRLDPDRSDAISASVREIARRVHEASLASDTGTLRERLTAARDAILDAADLINTAEREARETALAKLGEAA